MLLLIGQVFALNKVKMASRTAATNKRKNWKGFAHLQFFEPSEFSIEN